MTTEPIEETQPAITHESVLREIWRIRKARKAKFVSYEDERALKRAEKIVWQQAEDLIEPRAKVVDPVDRSIAKKKAARR